MKDRLIMVTDLGTFKAFRLRKNELESTPQISLIDEFEPVKENPVNEAVKEYPPAEIASRARNNVELEQIKSAVKAVADRIDELAGQGGADSLYFAAPDKINENIIETLNPATRARIIKNVRANLTNVPGRELLDYFK